MKNKKELSSIKNPEFLLVIFMLIILAILVSVVLFSPVPQEDSTATAKDLLDYRQSILAVIVTAFGAWIGAGAAYYFGRENLRQAKEGMLEMKELSAKERLRRTLIRDIPPNQINWTVTKDEKIEKILKKLKEDPQIWFIPIVDDKGALVTVIHEESIWRYLVETGKKEGTLKEILEFIDKNSELKKWTYDICVKISLDNSADFADELIREKKKQRKKIFLAIVTDQKDKPTHYITTGDLREIIMKSD